MLEGHATCKYYNNHRITDAQTLKTVKECSGLARSEVEARMSRSLRTSGTAGTAVNVVSGNFFFTAQPIGVIDGVDYQYTGDVRKIDAKNMRARLDAGDVVLLTSVGYGASGESYYVLTADLAAKCAGALVSRRFARPDSCPELQSMSHKMCRPHRLDAAIAIATIAGRIEARMDYSGADDRVSQHWRDPAVHAVSREPPYTNAPNALPLKPTRRRTRRRLSDAKAFLHHYGVDWRDLKMKSAPPLARLKVRCPPCPNATSGIVILLLVGNVHANLLMCAAGNFCESDPRRHAGRESGPRHCLDAQAVPPLSHGTRGGG